MIAAILAAEPKPVTSFQPLIPPALVHLIDTCLAKDPDDRRQNMHDVLLELRWIAEGGSQAGVPKPVVEHRKRRERLAWVVAAVAAAAALALAGFHFRETPAPVYAVRFEQPVPLKNTLQWWDVPAVSPDGRSFAYTGVKSGAKPMLWLRRLDAVQATALPGTEDSALPFWSPDSRFIGYYADGKLRKIDANGGPPQILCDADAYLGGAWNHDGLILLGERNGALHQVPSSGGELKPLLKLDAANKELRQAWPHFLPDGRHFLYASYGGDTGKSGTYLGSIDGQEPRRLLDTISNASFVSPGLLLFGRGRALMAQPFDSGRLQLGGEPFPVADLVGRAEILQHSIYSSSPNGSLVYRSETSAAADLQPAWYDRNGKRLGSMTFLNTNGQSFYRLAPGAGAKPETLLKTEYSKDEPRVSPDGRWVAYNTNESGRWEVYVAAFPSFTARRQVSNNGGVQGYWRKDGKELFYLALDGNIVSVPVKPGPALEAGMPKVLFPTRVPVQPNWDQFAVTGDGQRFLVLESIETEAKPFTIVLNWPAAVKR